MKFSYCSVVYTFPRAPLPPDLRPDFLSGHADVKTTEIYAHVLARDIHQLQSPLDGIYTRLSYPKRWACTGLQVKRTIRRTERDSGYSLDAQKNGTDLCSWIKDCHTVSQQISDSRKDG